MRSFTLLALGLFIAGFVVPVQAQSEKRPITKDILTDLAARRSHRGPFVILTPEDLKNYSVPDAIDPCSTAIQIDFGTKTSGTLMNTDCQLDDGSWADFYAFNGTATQQITLSMSSTDFDTYLGVATDSGSWVITDDDGGGGTDSRIMATLPETGVYIILANSAFANQFGAYTLELVGSTVCTYSVDPVSKQIPGNGGTYSFNVITQDGCRWTTSYDVYSFVHTVTEGGIGPGSVTFTADPNASASPTGDARSTVIRVNNNAVFTVNQDYLACTYSISPNSADYGPDPGTYSFQMNTAVGCPWLAAYDFNNSWLWTSTDLKRGPGPVEYTIAANNGGDRMSTITVAGYTFTVHQTGRNCTYSVSPLSLRISAAGADGQFTIDTQPGCTWNFSGAYDQVYIPSGYGGTGPGTKSFHVWPNYGFTTRTWILQFYGLNYTNIQFTQPGVPFRTRFDFFGDSKVDFCVYRPTTHQWILRDSQFNGNYTYSFGSNDDVMVPGDFDGDRATEIAMFRPSNGTWYILNRGTNTYSAVQFGLNGDIPAPADFDGDGKTDIAVFRPTTGIWYIMRSSGGVTILQFGSPGDQPVAADYDGDHKDDVAIWRPSKGEWWVLSSSGGAYALQFGISTDKAVPGDYTGDGKTDIAVWRPSNGYWYVLRSEDYSYFSFPFGVAGDLPAPGDYDADGMFDAAVYRPSNAIWYVHRSSSTPISVPFGQPGDVPVPGAFVR